MVNHWIIIDPLVTGLFVFHWSNSSWWTRFIRCFIIMISPILRQNRSLHFLGVATGSCFFHSCLAGRAGRILPVLPGVELQGSGYSFEVLTIKCESSSMVFPSHLQTNPRVFHSSMMSFGKTHAGGVKHGKTKMQFVGSIFHASCPASCPASIRRVPWWSPLLDLQRLVLPWFLLQKR